MLRPLSLALSVFAVSAGVAIYLRMTPSSSEPELTETAESVSPPAISKPNGLNVPDIPAADGGFQSSAGVQRSDEKQLKSAGLISDEAAMTEFINSLKRENQQFRWIQKSGSIPIIQIIDEHSSSKEPSEQWLGDSLIFMTKEEETEKDLLKELKSSGVSAVFSLGSQKLWLAAISPHSMDEYFHIYRKLNSSQKVSGVSQNQTMTITVLPNDPLLPVQYAVGDIKTNAIIKVTEKTIDLRLSPNPNANLKADLAWEKKRDCRTIRIGVLDSGIDVNHPDLKENINTSISKNFATERRLQAVCSITSGDSLSENVPLTVTESKYNDDSGHGTHVAGTIGAVGNNETGVSGVCWKAEIVALRVANSCGSADRSALLAAINYAKNQKIRVLNISMGSPVSSNKEAEALASNVVKSFLDSGGLIIAAAGNSKKDISVEGEPVFPASLEFKSLLTVASLNADNNLSIFSNYAPQKVHVAAPGEMILSTYPSTKPSVKIFEIAELLKDTEPKMATSFKDALKAIPSTGYEMLSGTSMAAPHVSGAAALVWSLNPALKNTEVASILLDTSDIVSTLTDKVANGRRINLKRAVQSVLGYQIEMSSSPETKNSDVGIMAESPIIVKISDQTGINLDNATLSFGEKVIGKCSKTDSGCVGLLPSFADVGSSKSSMSLSVGDGVKTLNAGSVRVLGLSDQNGLFKSSQNRTFCRAVASGKTFSVFTAPDFATCKNLCRILLSGTRTGKDSCEYGDLSETLPAESCSAE
jgi:subtilisin family serine protease